LVLVGFLTRICNQEKVEIFALRRQNCGAYIKLESCVDRQITSFATLQTRLLQLVNSRIDNGEFTERGLARLIGISQPQIHNVLKGKRKLQTALADRIMKRFEISVLDLFCEAELREQLIARASTHTRDILESVAFLQRASADPEACPRKPSGRAATNRPPAKDLAS
jgi:plasmid maintenance system antidote protein VapI